MYQNLSETSLNIPLRNQEHFRLNKLNEFKDYFVAYIKKRELISKRLRKHIASFDYFNKSVTVLSVTADSIYIALFVTVIGESVRKTSTNFSFAFSICTGIVKKLLKATRNKNSKYNKIVMLAESKLNSIGSKIFEALIKNEISHEDFVKVINKEKKYRELKKSIRILNC